ncbi:MAG: hypothetical protein V4787_06690 [Pseudomonadota bacterium]
MSTLLRVLAIAAALAVLAWVLAMLPWPQGDSAVNSAREPAAVSPTIPTPVQALPSTAQLPSSSAAPAPASASAAAQPADPFKAFIEQAERAKADAAKSPFSRP